MLIQRLLLPALRLSFRPLGSHTYSGLILATSLSQLLKIISHGLQSRMRRGGGSRTLLQEDTGRCFLRAHWRRWWFGWWERLWVDILTSNSTSCLPAPETNDTQLENCNWSQQETTIFPNSVGKKWWIVQCHVTSVNKDHDVTLGAESEVPRPHGDCVSGEGRKTSNIRMSNNWH